MLRAADLTHEFAIQAGLPIKTNMPYQALDDAPDDDVADSSLQAAEFATGSVAGPDQFDEFRAAYRGVTEIFPARARDKTFPVRQKIWHLDRMVLVCVQLPGPGYAFGWRHVRRAELDHYYVLLPLGEPGAEVFQKRAPGVSLHCLARPFQSEIEAHGMLLLFIPRDLVPNEIDEVLDRRLDEGAGLLLADFLTLLCRRLSRLRQTELPGVFEAIRGLVAACAAPSEDQRSSEREQIDRRLLNRARQLIRRRIMDSDLSPETLCRELFVSRSRLYRTFEPWGGVAAHIRRERLLRARDAILDTGSSCSIARIAERWGFPDASTFSRTFKKEFGLSPKAARRAGWAERGRLEGRIVPRDRADSSSLYALLRRLGT